MIKYFTFFCLLFFSTNCTQSPGKVQAPNRIEEKEATRLYSKSVADSFSIFVNLPNDYSLAEKKKYPVVYLLDANLYFDVMATTLNKYSEVGLAPSVIL